MIGSVIGIVVLARARAAAKDEPEASADEDGDDPSIMRTELPFGPFLCMAAVFYVFAEPYLQVNFRFLGG
jgi:prepilin signal peptidase PulO-like enzyme (type II secretory pathway)